MYCLKCGKEIAQESRFCAACGAENVNYAEAIPVPLPLEETPKKKSRGKKIALAVAAIAAALLIVYLIFGGNRIGLKYDWGTDMQSVESEEYVEEIERDFSTRSAYMYIYDEDHDVDRFDEFQIADKVTYGFYDDKLVLISYDIDRMGMRYEDMVEIVAEYYGDDYYQEGDYRTYWWVGDTVISLDEYGSICYYWEKYYGGITGTLGAESVRKYFGK